MALLNFATLYLDIADKFPDVNDDSSRNYVKLFFTLDGHIVTHGRDFLATFSATDRGLVPKSGGDAKKVLRGNATWEAITTTDLPIGTVASGSPDAIPTALDVKKAINDSFIANDAMRYKGTITKTSDGYTHNTNGTETPGFPPECKVGDTYRIQTQGKYGGYESCSAGDLLICIKDGSGSGINSLEYWTAVEANINGEVKHQLNGDTVKVYSSSTDTFKMFAPTTGGVAGLVLVSNGNAAPRWADQNTLIVKQANKVKNALSAGVGLSLGGQNVTYDGETARTIRLKAATGSEIGGVSIDKDAATENKTISVDSTGNIYLTAENIRNALGYLPGDAALGNTYKTIITNSATSTTAANGNFINLVLTVGSSTTVTGSTLIVGNGKISVSGTASTLSIGLNAADASNYGGIKIGYSPNNNRNYAVQLDSNGKAFVNVPWTDSNWRPINVNGTSIGNKTLNFKPVEDSSIYMYLDIGNTTDNIYDLGFGLCWYNISNDSIEIP